MSVVAPTVVVKVSRAGRGQRDALSEFAGFDLDRSTERAWSRFQVKLADHLAEMRDDDMLIVSADSAVDDKEEGAAPYVQFVAWGETMVRSEVASNAYLAEEARLDGAAERMIAGLGWHEPTAGKDDDDLRRGRRTSSWTSNVRTPTGWP
jgi:hypothetical protein